MSDFINKTTFQIKRSVHDPDMKDQPDWVELSDMEIPECEFKYLKWSDSKNIVEEMTSGEKVLVDQAIADSITLLQENAKDIDSMEKLTKSLALVLLDEINELRVNAGLQERTITQLKNAVKVKYENL